MSKLWGRVLCLFGKHGRGKRIDGPRLANVAGFVDLQPIVVYECSRKCGATWTRKVKK